MIAMRLAAIGFLASAAAHLLSFTPWARLLGERTIWTLEVGVFLLALWMIARLRRTAAIRRQWGRVAVHDWRGLVAAVPPGLRFLVIGAALYAWMNFVRQTASFSDAGLHGIRPRESPRRNALAASRSAARL